MTDTALIESIKTVSTWTVPTLLLLILYLGWKQVWVWGSQLQAMTADRDWWRSQAVGLLKTAEHTAEALLPSNTGQR